MVNQGLGPLDPFAGYNLPPRRWQSECYPIAMAAIRAREKGVIHACTGAGKTRLQVAILKTIIATLQPKYRIIVTVPKLKLLKQTVKDARKVLGRGSVAPWYGVHKHDAQIIVCCQDSMESLLDMLDMHGLKVAIWMADECHRANSEAFRDLVENRMRPITRIGLSATPFPRLESEALAGWERVVYSYPIDDAIEEGVLVPPVTVLWDGPDEYDAVLAMIQMIHTRAPPGPGIVSAKDKKVAREVAEALTLAGIPATEIHSGHSDKEQERKIAALLRGEYRCLVHVDLLTEGVDIPSIRWIGMLKTRGSHVAILQEGGRGLRVLNAPDRWGPKTECVFLMHIITQFARAKLREAALTLDPVERVRKLMEYEAREVDPDAEYIMPTAQTVGDITGWLAGLLQAVEASGVTMPDPSTAEGPWRTWGASRRQVETLRDLMDDGRKAPTKYMPSEHRDAIKLIVSMPELLNAGGASDLLSILIGLRRAGGIYAGQHKDAVRVGDRFWKGLHFGLPNPPDLSGLRPSKTRTLWSEEVA